MQPARGSKTGKTCAAAGGSKGGAGQGKGGAGRGKGGGGGGGNSRKQEGRSDGDDAAGAGEADDDDDLVRQNLSQLLDRLKHDVTWQNDRALSAVAADARTFKRTFTRRKFSISRGKSKAPGGAVVQFDLAHSIQQVDIAVNLVTAALSKKSDVDALQAALSEAKTAFEAGTYCRVACTI